MFGRLFFIFVGLPLLELTILVWLGSRIGFLPTIASILITGALGAILARAQGARVLREIRAELEAGRPPAARLLDGLLILIGGLLLLAPGVITDLVGFALLLPPTRNRLRRRLRARFEWMASTGQVSYTMLLR